MHSVLDLMIKRQTASYKKSTKGFSKNQIVYLVKKEFEVYDFKSDTDKILGKIANARDNTSEQLYKKIMVGIADLAIPALPKGITINPNELTINNEIFMDILEQYYKKGASIPTTDKVKSESHHAINTYLILNSYKDIDFIKYEDYEVSTKATRNIHIKSVLSHQSHCPCCGIELDDENVSIDHLVAKGDKYKDIIEKEDVNNIFNLTLMCKQCNERKGDMSLIEWHNISNGFEFYPANLLYVLHLQQAELDNHQEHNDTLKSVLADLEAYIDRYADKYRTNKSSVKVEKSLEALPKDLFRKWKVNRNDFKDIILNVM